MKLPRHYSHPRLFVTTGNDRQNLLAAYRLLIFSERTENEIKIPFWFVYNNHYR